MPFNSRTPTLFLAEEALILFLFLQATVCLRGGSAFSLHLSVNLDLSKPLFPRVDPQHKQQSENLVETHALRARSKLTESEILGKETSNLFPGDSDTHSSLRTTGLSQIQWLVPLAVRFA